MDIASLQHIATKIRIHIIDMLERAGSGHPGGSLSAADIMTALYFGGILKHNPKDPQDDTRDRFVLSKGHAAPVLYAVLAESGYFPVEELSTLRAYKSRLQGHPDSLKLPGVEISTGSLGQGLSISSGIASALRLQGNDAHVFTLLGDGELQEGQVWEAALFAAHQGLDHLVAIVDNNHLQIDGNVSDVCDIDDVAEKFKAFGWDVFSCDGNNMGEVYKTLIQARDTHNGKPKVVVAQTIKGKGVSFMQDNAGWHGKAPNAQEASRAREELLAQEA
ncbi:MAG: transketolase [Eggerthellaceae bacterium]|nr:transketolase [Eggerthellaceae bacterium]